MELPAGYHISSDPTRLDLPRICRWLTVESYWARERPARAIERSFANSLSFGVYRPDGRQVAVARVVTDLATFAWLCDVFVAADERARGIGSCLVRAVRDDLDARGVPRITLGTDDAHGVYARLGFTALADPTRWMERRTTAAPAGSTGQQGQVSPLTSKGQDRE